MEHRELPVARLRPRDAGEQLVVLRGKATDSARRVGHVAAVTTKAVAMIALCGAGVFLVGASRSPHPIAIDRNLLRDFKPKFDVTRYDLIKFDQPKIDLLKDIRFDRERLSKWRGRELPAPMPAELPATSAP